MARDILRRDPQAIAVAQVVAHVAPDILMLQGVDYDHNLHGAMALRDLMSEHGIFYPHAFALPTNAGAASGIDLDGDGRTYGPRDAQGYGRFYGDGAMVLFSRWPIATEGVQDFSALLWRDLPGATLPEVDNRPFPSAMALEAQRLSSVGHWSVPVTGPDGKMLNLLTFAAGPPVFDGPEDRNGLRNADELRLVSMMMAGEIGKAPEGAFVVLGNANLDPDRGEGRQEAIRALLSDRRLQDPHAGMGPTVDWTDPIPGNLRVDYVLPSADLAVFDAGVFWPRKGTEEHATLSHKGTDASRHRLVWVDLDL
ncbi:endonuclease/exonuclease/phosphatase family protein [Shimia abyssi]|nr:endonuclease/exonuclease/phosphatase family protein [Shimia abyssi]